jgi:hypothetical protein
MIHGYVRNLVDRAWYLFAPDNVDPISDINVQVYTEHVTIMLNKLLEEAAQLAEDIDSGKYTSTKTAAEAIRETKVR